MAWNVKKTYEEKCQRLAPAALQNKIADNVFSLQNVFHSRGPSPAGLDYTCLVAERSAIAWCLYCTIFVNCVVQQYHMKVSPTPRWWLIPHHFSDIHEISFCHFIFVVEVDLEFEPMTLFISVKSVPLSIVSMNMGFVLDEGFLRFSLSTGCHTPHMSYIVKCMAVQNTQPYPPSDLFHIINITL